MPGVMLQSNSMRGNSPTNVGLLPTSPNEVYRNPIYVSANQGLQGMLDAIKTLMTVEAPTTGGGIILLGPGYHIYTSGGAIAVDFASLAAAYRGGSANAVYNGITILGCGPLTTYIYYDRAGTVFNIAPADGNKSIAYCKIASLTFASNDTTSTKVAISCTNVEATNFDSIHVPDGAWKGNNSCAIETNGRQFIKVNDCTLFADQPIHCKVNPSVGYGNIPADFLKIYDSVLAVTPAVSNASILIDDAVYLTNVKISGCSFNRGIGILKWNKTNVITGLNIVIEDARLEQDIAGGFLLDLTGNGNAQSVILRNVTGGTLCGGIRARTVSMLTLDQVFFTSSGCPLDIDGTVANTVLSNSRFPSGGTAPSLVNQNLIAQFNKSTESLALPANAHYQSTTVTDAGNWVRKLSFLTALPAYANNAAARAAGLGIGDLYVKSASDPLQVSIAF